MRSTPDRRVRELYAKPPAEFTAARDALARSLAAEGSPAAARVKRLRRPTVAVWLLDALARERPDDLESLFAAGDRLRQAQVRALRGDGAELREASAALRDALDALVGAVPVIAAAGLGREPGAAVLGEIEGALRAVATSDAAARVDLEGGVLDRLPRAGGMELLGGLAALGDAEPARPGRDPDHPSARGGAQPSPSAGHPAADRRRGGPPAKHERRAEERAREAAEREARAESRRRDRERRRAASEAQRLERAQRAAEDRLRAAERALETARRRAETVRSEAAAAGERARAARERAEAARRDGDGDG